MNRRACILAALLGAGASVAMGQTRPSDLTGMTPAYGLTPAAGLTPNPIYQLPAARAASAGAAVHLQNAKDDLEDFVRVQRTVFENSAEYSKALADQDAAYKKFAAARQKVIDGLMMSPEYEATVKLRDDTARQIEIEKARPHPDKQRLDEWVAYRAALSRKVGDLETPAMAQDGALAEARTNLVNAGMKVQSMRRDFDLRLRTSQELAGAKHTVKDSREQFAVANVYATETARMADILLNYAYYTTYRATRKPDVIASPLVPYGYDYGYGGFGARGTGLTNGVTPVQGTVGGAGFGYMPYQ